VRHSIIPPATSCESVCLGTLFDSSAERVDNSTVIGVTNVKDDAKGKKDDVTNAGVHGVELKL
jgi:hypothetical protein